MKKYKVISLGIALAGMAGMVQASIGIWGEYGMVGMADINDKFAADLKSAEDLLGKGTVTKSANSYMAGVELGVGIAENIALGARAGYAMVSEGKVVTTNDLAAPLLAWTTTTKFNGYAIPILGGGRITVPVTEALSLKAGLFGGYAFGKAVYDSKTTTTIIGFDTVTEHSTEMEAKGVAGEVLLGVALKVASNVSLGVDVGYRMMALPLTYAKNDDAAGIKAGDAVKNSDDKSIKMDMSGINVAVSVVLAF